LIGGHYNRIVSVSNLRN